jgi:predicted TIM-barrel fold metal-dependent hydrolase
MKYIDIQVIIDHYARMALESGSVDHARHQVKEMENNPTGMFKGLGKAVAQRMKEINESSENRPEPS